MSDKDLKAQVKAEVATCLRMMPHVVASELQNMAQQAFDHARNYVKQYEIDDPTGEIQRCMFNSHFAYLLREAEKGE